MNRRQVTTAMVFGGAALALGQREARPPGTLAGGWASLELVNPLHVAIVGVSVVIDAQMLQHGVHPSAILPGAIRFLDEETGEEQIAHMEVISEPLALVRGEVTLTQPGTYRMTTWNMGPEVGLGSLEAIAPEAGDVISALRPEPELACAEGEIADAVETDILDGAFADPLLEVPAGSTVRWVNTSVVPHQVVFEDRTIDGSAMLKEGDMFSVTFREPGEYAYHCAPHPYMMGTVRVG